MCFSSKAECRNTPAHLSLRKVPRVNQRKWKTSNKNFFAWFFFFFPIFVHLTAKEVAVPLAKLGKEQYLTFTCIEDSFKYLLLSATRKTLFHINKNQAQKAGFQLCIHDLTFRLSVLRHTTFLSPILLDLQKSQLLAIEKGESLLASGLSLQRDWFLSDPPVCLILESLTEVNECEALIRKLKKKKKVKH